VVDVLNSSLLNKANYKYLFNYGSTINERHMPYDSRITSLTFYNIYIPNKYIDNVCSNEYNICISSLHGKNSNKLPTDYIKDQVLFKYAPELFHKSRRSSHIPHLLSNKLVKKQLLNNPEYLSNIAKFNIANNGIYLYDLVGDAKLLYDEILRTASTQGAIKIIYDSFFYDNCVDCNKYISKNCYRYYTETKLTNYEDITLFNMIKLFIHTKGFYHMDNNSYDIYTRHFIGIGHNTSNCGTKQYMGDNFLNFIKSRDNISSIDVRSWSNNFIKNGPLSGKLDKNNLHSDYNARLLRIYNVSRVNTLSKNDSVMNTFIYKDS